MAEDILKITPDGKLFSVVATMILRGDLAGKRAVCTLGGGLCISYRPGQSLGVGRLGVEPSVKEVMLFMKAVRTAGYVLDDSTRMEAVGPDGKGGVWRSVSWSAPVHVTKRD